MILGALLLSLALPSTPPPSPALLPEFPPAAVASNTSPFDVSVDLKLSPPSLAKSLSRSRTPTGPRPYFGARYYGSKIGRFTSVDPVYSWRENLVDPQRWNRYAYVRNNPLRYTDPDGRVINDTPLQNNAQYQKWKGEYLSQPGAPSQWNALNDDPGITVNIGWDTKGMASVTSGYVWDDSGKLTTVDVTFAAKTGNVGNTMDAEAGYVYGSTITDAKERHSYVFAHELAHVEYAQTATGRAGLTQRDQDVAFLQQQLRALGLKGYTSSPDVSSTQKRVTTGAHERETSADSRARQVLGKQP
jgi:RHS repeat-associated protein